MEDVIVQVAPETVDRYSRVDRRMVVLENMSAECGALLTKIQIKQYRGRASCELPTLETPIRTLLQT